MKKYLVKILLKFIDFNFNQKFLPNRLGIFFNPFYILRKRIYNFIDVNKSYISGKILDYGCGTSPYKSVFNYEEYNRADIIVNQVDDITLIDNSRTIYDENYFDSIICSEVLEHVEDIQATIQELHRVLKLSGTVVVTTPFVWQVHGHPYDFRRFTLAGIVKLFEENNFEVLVKEKGGNYFETLFQLFITKLFLKIQVKNYWLNIILSVLVSPFSFLGLFFGLFTKDTSLYMSNLIVVRKI